MSEENKSRTEEIKKEKKEQEDVNEEIKELKSKLNKKGKEIKLLKKEKEEFKEKFLRKAADMENLRKRMERDKDDHYKYALSEFIKELLTVLDNFERALGSRDQESDESFREGMELIHKQYLDLLMKKGLKPIEIKDKKFDPNLHQAIVTEESDDVEEQFVGEEFQKGYSLYDRLLRPTLVKVIVPKKGE